MTRTRLAAIFAAACLASLLIASGANAAYPGKNGRIVFHYAGDIWSVKPNGTDAKRVTKTAAKSESDPTVSPDGKRVAFEVDGENIATSNMKGKNVRNVTKGKGGLGKPYGRFLNPAWSKNGSRLVFTCVSNTYPYPGNLCKSKDEKQANIKKFVGCECVGVSDSDAPDVSRNNLIAFAGKSSIWTVPFGGGAPKSILKQSGDGEYNYMGWVSWAPTGARMVFQGREADPTIDVINANGSGLRRLLDSPDLSQDPSNTTYRSPAWSPNGKLVVFVLDNTSGGRTPGLYTFEPNAVNPSATIKPLLANSSFNFDQYVAPNWGPKP